MMKGKRVGNGDGTSKKRYPTTFEITLPSTFRQFLNLEDVALMTGQENEKMTGGTPEVRSDKNLTLLTFDIQPIDQWTNSPMVQWSNGSMIQ